VSQGITDGAVETVGVSAKVGYYLLVASGYPAVNATYKGEVKLTVAAAAPPAVVVPVAPVAPAAQPLAKKKKLSCKQKARKLKSARKRKAALRKCRKR
jgi:hypothetical protein